LAQQELFSIHWGSLPCLKETLNIRVSAGAMLVAVSFSNLEGVTSGPGICVNPDYTIKWSPQQYQYG